MKSQAKDLEQLTKSLRIMGNRISLNEMWEIANELGCSWMTVRRYVREGKVGKLQMGLRMKEAIERYIIRRSKRLEIGREENHTKAEA